MSNTKLRMHVWPVALALLGSALGILACGGKVVLDGDFGAGGGGGGSVSSSVNQSSASTGAGPQCSELVCTGLGTDVCTCDKMCGTVPLSVNCAPNPDNGKLQCICSYDDTFSGACFEEKGAPCDMDKGCCAKYFQGI